MLSFRTAAVPLIWSLLLTDPAFGQWQSVLKSAQQDIQRNGGRIASRAQTQAQAAQDIASGEDRAIANAKRAYAGYDAKGLTKSAGHTAWSIGNLYETRHQDYTNAAAWYQTSYKKGVVEASTNLVNLILTHKVAIDNPDGIRPFVEIRAGCGSHIARAYMLEHWQETPEQIPNYSSEQQQRLTGCSPVGPDDHMEPSVFAQRVRAQEQAQRAAYYRQHPDQTPEAQQEKAIQGALLFLGSMLVVAATMPATGPGSIACNKLQNGFPGADPKACDTPVPHGAQ